MRPKTETKILHRIAAKKSLGWSQSQG